jgi:acetyltransferase-like isoleucine patch superfamily enzyme
LAVIMGEVAHRFGVEIPIETFLASPTIETIAAQLQRKESPATVPAASAVTQAKPIRDSKLAGLKNRIFQVLALYAPGYKTTRVWLHRMRGVSIGENASIGLSAIIESAYPSLVRIGNNVTIGMRVIVIGHLRDSTAQARARHEHTVTIEDGAYIGPGVIILPNVTIGRGAVVSAGSVVSRSVPAHTLVRGNPAVPIARCGVSLGGGVSYEEFVRQLRPLKDGERPEGI